MACKPMDDQTREKLNHLWGEAAPTPPEPSAEAVAWMRRVDYVGGGYVERVALFRDELERMELVSPGDAERDEVTPLYTRAALMATDPLRRELRKMEEGLRHKAGNWRSADRLDLYRACLEACADELDSLLEKHA